MLQDKLNTFSDAYAPTATGTTYSDVYDQGVAQDIGGFLVRNLDLLIQVVTAFTSGGSATMAVTFETSPDNATWEILAQSRPVAVAELTQGFRFLRNKVPGKTSRYMRVGYIIATAAMTAGAISAAFVPGVQDNTSYPRGYVA